MKLAYTIAFAALLFNIVFVLLTWPFGESFIFGSDNLARGTYNLKSPANSLLFAAFGIAVGWMIWRRRLSAFHSLVALLVLGSSTTISWYFDANRIFRTLEQPQMATTSEVDYPDELQLITVTSGGHSRAYPIQFLAYHHLIQDSINGTEFDITYCVLVDQENVFEHKEGRSLELVAARRNNTVYRDRESDTWWQQQNGVAIAGTHEGQSIQSHPSFRMSFQQWREMFPNEPIMVAQPGYGEIYKQMFPRLWPESSN